jgi:hypothetical protein
MTDKTNHRLKPLPTANYSSAVARAVAWLGDRYLLAKPINASPGRSTGGPLGAFDEPIGRKSTVG